MATLADYRAKYPQYDDLSDAQLADSLYGKFYADIPRAEFDSKLGISPQPGNVAAPAQGYQDALAAGSNASQSLVPQPVTPAGPDFMGSMATTLAGINTIPILGPLLQNSSDAIIGTGAQLTGGNYGDTVRGLQDRREELAKANPLANLAGSVGANLAAFGVAGAPRAIAAGLSPAAMTLAGGETIGSSALGLTGSTAAKVGSGLGSTYGLTATDNMIRGQSPIDAAMNAGLPALAGGAIPGIGAGIRKGAEGVANALTQRAQNALTKTAIQGAPDAAALKSAASTMFDSATGGTPLAINDNAYFRFLSGVKQYADKLRINPDNDPQATGLLSTLMRIADDTSQGVAVDLKDLHLIRQLARKVSGSSQGRDASMGSAVVHQLDELVKSLKPADILGGADPAAATTNLLKGISTWSRASKVGLVEEAIEKAGTYKSGLENGLRLQFQSLLRNPETRRLFTDVERAEIEKVANGTTGTNLVTLLGKFGFGANGAQNMLGGTVGALGTSAFLGPVGGIAAAIGATGARRLSEKLGSDAATRAAQTVATPNIPIARPFSVPQPIQAGITAAELASRGALLGGS